MRFANVLQKIKSAFTRTPATAVKVVPEVTRAAVENKDTEEKRPMRYRITRSRTHCSCKRKFAHWHWCRFHRVYVIMVSGKIFYDRPTDKRKCEVSIAV